MYGTQKVDSEKLKLSFSDTRKPPILGDSCDKSCAKGYDTDSCQRSDSKKKL